MKNEWDVTVRLKEMVVKTHIDFPEPFDVIEEVDEEGIRELIQAFMGAQDGSIQYEIVKIVKVPE